MSRKVIIATPSLDGRVEALYAYSLAQTVGLGVPYGIQFMPLMVIRDALIQNARNDLFAMAYQSDATDVLWIDSDISWKPEEALRLLSHCVDVVGGTYRRKEDAESYVVKCPPERLVAGENGLIEVEALGLGFLYMSRKAMTHLWEAGEPYRSNGQDRRWIFDVRPEAGEVVSEDVRMCTALRAGGFPIHLDPSITCSHTGAKTFVGDFAAWAAAVLHQQGHHNGQDHSGDLAQADREYPAASQE